MKFSRPLVQAKLIQRYKRFLADVVLFDDTTVTAHVANPGSMLGMKHEGLRVWLEPNDDPKRKLNYSWKVAELDDGTLIGVDTGMPNKIVKEALHDRAIPELAYDDFRAEVKYGENSRIDFLLSQDGGIDTYLEVKSVTLSREKGLVEFPDCVTKRGTKHMDELAAMVAQGHRAVLLYLVQRDDAERFQIAADLDVKYKEAVDRASAVGVELLCYDVAIAPDAILIGKRLPFASD